MTYTTSQGPLCNSDPQVSWRIFNAFTRYRITNFARSNVLWNGKHWISASANSYHLMLCTTSVTSLDGVIVAFIDVSLGIFSTLATMPIRLILKIHLISLANAKTNVAQAVWIFSESSFQRNIIGLYKSYHSDTKWTHKARRRVISECICEWNCPFIVNCDPKSNSFRCGKVFGNVCI